MAGVSLFETGEAPRVTSPVVTGTNVGPAFGGRPSQSQVSTGGAGSNPLQSLLMMKQLFPGAGSGSSGKVGIPGVGAGPDAVGPNNFFAEGEGFGTVGGADVPFSMASPEVGAGLTGADASLAAGAEGGELLGGLGAAEGLGGLLGKGAGAGAGAGAAVGGAELAELAPLLLLAV